MLHQFPTPVQTGEAQVKPTTTQVDPRKRPAENVLQQDFHADRPNQKWVTDITYVGRMLRLTSLAPDIIEAILCGDEPNGISLRKRQKNLPVRWDEQRKLWRPSRPSNVADQPRCQASPASGLLGGLASPISISIGPSANTFTSLLVHSAVTGPNGVGNTT